ncbi:MAG: hypothetical protein DHS20C09_04200 [marine bacterium B5-7]|nr:MAG: hypothetical protein DHS20C09_04200 [marine bacterium B5-7]
MSRYRVFITIVITTLFLFGCNNVETRDARYKNTSKYDDPKYMPNKVDDTPPFGSKQDIDYAANLWQEMTKHKLVGVNSLRSTPYEGIHPHGAILDTMQSTLSLNRNVGDVIVKKNYGGENISKEAVADAPEQWLKAITVMYQRESGYDSDNKDWFWVKYAPDGSVLTNPKGMHLAGRVAKGMDQGCIACHTSAPGGDMVFNSDRE